MIQPRSYLVAHMIAARMEPKVAAAFLAAVYGIKGNIDMAALVSAVAGGNPDVIVAALATGGNLASLLIEGDMRQLLLRTSTATGTAGVDVLRAGGITARFNASDPRVVLFAREQTAALVVEVARSTREAVQIVTALGQTQGLTVIQQSRAIREIVGLPSVWADAPLRLRQNILDGDVGRATRRRLSATDKAQIRKRIKDGTADESFADRMAAKYTRSLENRRAQNIARTETLTASHHGQREGWRQAIEQGALPKSSRRVWVVTPDDRLREAHAVIPGLNPEGVGLDQPFVTLDGSVDSPPYGTNCRCGVALIFPGRRGAL